MQAQTVARRVVEASEIWGELDSVVATNRLPERVAGILYEAVLGYRVRRSGGDSLISDCYTHRARLVGATTRRENG